jgi:hypothetical protein
MVFRWTALFVFANILVGASFAQSSSGSTASHACASIVQAVERLACYDRTFGVEASASQSQPAVQTALPVAEFGFTAEQAQRQKPRSAGSDAPDSIATAVAAIETRASGKFVVSLTNGQVWVQVEVNERARLERGDAVTIRKALMNSYLLVTPGGVATRVRRLR